NGVDVVVPGESIIAISERFANTAYGFFLEKREAYLVVANYVRSTWGKYGLVKSMLKSFIGIFFFQFSSMEGLDAMLENGPSEDGLSVIATKVGTPLMLDSCTSDMCIQSCGRSSYTRALIEVRADVELKDNIVVVMPKIIREGDECSKNKVSNMVENIKKPSQTHRSIIDKILATLSETSKVENTPAEMLCDLDQQMEKRGDDGKANVVTDALSRKERVKPRRVRAMAMTIQYRVRGMILAAQSEAFKQENVFTERLHGLD
ncbi:hypothetical protein Tco_1032989, partial [Tanacetum coccineum]